MSQAGCASPRSPGGHGAGISDRDKEREDGKGDMGEVEQRLPIARSQGLA